MVESLPAELHGMEGYPPAELFQIIIHPKTKIMTKFIEKSRTKLWIGIFAAIVFIMLINEGLHLVSDNNTIAVIIGIPVLILAFVVAWYFILKPLIKTIKKVYEEIID